MLRHRSVDVVEESAAGRRADPGRLVHGAVEVGADLRPGGVLRHPLDSELGAPREHNAPVGIERGEETLIALPTTGVLGVALDGVEGPRQDVRVDVVEPLTGEVYGVLVTGERRLVMPGKYNLEIATVPPRTLPDVIVEPGGSRLIALGGLAAIAVADSVPVGGSLRLEVLTIGGAQGLGEATGRAPSLSVWAGTYLARVWSGADLVWEGRVTVAEGERARIDFDAP